MQFIQTDIGILRGGDDGYLLLDTTESLDAMVKRGALAALEAARVVRSVTLDAVTVLPPVQPEQFVIAGLNYRAHCAEIGVDVPGRLVFGFAPGTALSTTGRDIVRPAEAPDEVDYEGELAVVIGKRCRRVPKDKAASVVAGYCVNNDVSDHTGCFVFGHAPAVWSRAIA